MSDWSFPVDSETETERLGSVLGPLLVPQIVVALSGDLGAGKTRLVQAIASARGVNREEVNSPTFVLVQEYSGEVPLYHFDTYRLRDTDEFLELGADEMMFGGGICLIEWAEKVAEVLPADRLEISIEVTATHARTFHLHSTGPNAKSILEQLRQTFDQNND